MLLHSLIGIRPPASSVLSGPPALVPATHGLAASMPTDTRGAVTMMNGIHPETHNAYYHFSHVVHASAFRIILRARRSCFAFTGWDSLANHSLGLIALGFARGLTWNRSLLFTDN